ncbi:MAG: LLM class flavin-dependent oxidoreductase [Reyranellaceae bacterium]
MLKLSVLDQSPIRKGGTPAQAIGETLELAQLADRLGFLRYWVAEHHSSDALAGAAPEILIGKIASITRDLRVGSGGVMLSHYAALKVAETFRTLETLYPGRIDLGIGRAPGSDQRTARALQAGPEAYGIDYYPYQMRDLMAFLHDALPADHQFAGIVANPQAPTAPEVWVLGSSDQSAAYAAHFGLPFSFAHFISPQGGPSVVEAYRRHFKPSALHETPLANVGIAVLCADTEAKAEELAASRDLWVLRLLTTGNAGQIPPPDEAKAMKYSDEQRAWLRRIRSRTVVGTPEQVRAGLLARSREYGVDEFVCVTICYEHKDRLRSYELLAQAFELEARQAA